MLVELLVPTVRDLPKNNRGSNPTTLDGRISKAEDLNILEAEIEKA